MALVVTIVVLLILAGITIMYVMGDNSVFKQVADAKEQTAIAKAREKLELLLNEAQIKKHGSGLTEIELDEKITKVGELLPKEDPNSNNQQVIVDGFLFEIERSVPKIIDYRGPTNGVIITATINGLSNAWVSPDAVSITGKILTYSGGSITTVNATKNGTEIEEFSINSEGEYKITGITSDSTIVITAKDSNDKENSRTIPITIKVDNKIPIIERINKTLNEDIAEIYVIAKDDESGIKQLHYEINSMDDPNLEGIPSHKRTGTFKLDETFQITRTKPASYVISVIAEDNVGNKSEVEKIALFRLYLIKNGVDCTNVTGGWKGVPYYGMETGSLSFAKNGEGFATLGGSDANTIYRWATNNKIDTAGYGAIVADVLNTGAQARL